MSWIVGDLAFQATQARLRRDEASRPRDGWQLVCASGRQLWRWIANDGGTAHACGRQMALPWRFRALDAAGRVTEGEADTLAYAMR